MLLLDHFYFCHYQNTLCPSLDAMQAVHVSVCNAGPNLKGVFITCCHVVVT